MAALYKCTKITNLGNSPLVAGAYLVRVDFYNPTIPSPPLLSVQGSIPKEDFANPEDLKSDIDSLLSSVGTDTMNWTV